MGSGFRSPGIQQDRLATNSTMEVGIRALILGILGGLALGLAAPDSALTQDRRGRGSNDGGGVVRGPGGSVIILDDDDILRRLPRGGDRRDDPLYRDHGGEGIPKFCRTGEGHPVFGIQWCFDRRMRDETIPAFCRTGEGHPEFGRSWCLERGYGLGSLRGVIFGDDLVFLDLEDESDVVAVGPSVWGRILDILVPRAGRR